VVIAKTVQNHHGALGTFQQFRYNCRVSKLASSTNQDIIKLERSRMLCTASVLLVFSTCPLVERDSRRDQQCGILTCTSYSCFQTHIRTAGGDTYFFYSILITSAFSNKVSDHIFLFSEDPFLDVCVSCVFPF